MKMIGDKYGRLTIIGEEGRNKYGMLMVTCLCECGSTVTTRLNSLKRGVSKSCGCLRHELLVNKMTKHGMYGTKIYHSWQLMKTRCCDPSYHRFNDYGGRGIKVCQRWMDSFEKFLEDMGPTYESGLTIDRIDVNGDYCPENCKWSTRKEQSRNKRNNHFIHTKWGLITVAEAAEKSGIPEGTIDSRIRHGWSEEELLIPSKSKWHWIITERLVSKGE